MKRSMDYLKLFPHYHSSTEQEKEFKVDAEFPVQVDQKRTPGGWKCMPYIIGNETFEKVATFGLTANMVVYLVKQLHMDQITATNFGNIFFGITNFAPMLGAFISDAYWGRFRTLAYASISTFLGMVVLTLTATLPQLKPQPCSSAASQPAATQLHQCAPPSKTEMGVLILSLSLLTIGAAGVRPCSLPFGVDQFDVKTDKGRKELNSFFNWYYATTSAGLMLSLTVIVYIQDSVSWTIGFAVPTALMLVAIVLFFLGTRVYVHVSPEGSVFSGIVQVFVAAYRKRHLKLEESMVPFRTPILHDRVVKLPLTKQFRWLNKAAIECEGDIVIGPDGTVVNRWRLCSVQQIEEVKCLMRIIPIWSANMICFIAISQQWTFGVLQCLTMDRHITHRSDFQIPAASLIALSLLVLSIFMPIYDRLLVPLFRRFTGLESGITLLQRQAIGLLISTLSMVAAGIVERKRRTSALEHGGVSTPMSAFWLLPQLSLMAISEAFNAVGQIEFYNREFPEHMQTLANALFSCSLAGSGYLSALLVTIVRRTTRWLNNDINAGRVDYFYYLLAVIGVVNLLYFMICAHFYRYKSRTDDVDDDRASEMVDI